ncbi:MAG: flagellar basal body P-ring protein FlgI [Leptospirales bacterium]
MKYRSGWIPGLLVAVGIVFASQEAGAERIGDLARVQGMTDNPLVGYGLVVGLPGTGDTKQSPFTKRSLVSAIARLGINARDLLAGIRGHNVAAVMVTARLSPFQRQGARFTIRVASVGDATSLVGGTLLMTSLRAPNGKVYATAQGPVDTSAPGRIGERVNATDPPEGRRTSGMVDQGGLVVLGVPVPFNGRHHLWISLDRANFTTAARIVRAINAATGGRPAVAEDGRSVQVEIPEASRGDVVGYMARILNIRVTPDRTPLVVINQQTGTIVIGEGVRVSECAVSHRDLSVVVKGKKVVPPVKDKSVPLTYLARSVTLRSLVSALSALGTRTDDMIAILEALKASGALEAEIRVVG